jgi:hypothetical protein
MLLERTPVLVNCSLSQKYRTCLKSNVVLFWRLLSRRRLGDLMERVQNIHCNFMKTGWDGAFYGEALELKKII